MNKQTIEQLKKDWFKINSPVGIACGFPLCCIREFCEQPPELLKINKPTQSDRQRYRAACINGKFTGFVPCASHARLINSGRIRITELIKDRDKSLPPFPHFGNGS